MPRRDYLDLGFDFGKIRSYADYKTEAWRRLAPIQVTMIKEDEPCPHHRVGDSFLYRNHYDKPKVICSALHHVLQLYLFRASIGFPSWEEDDPSVYRVRCPDKNGTVWEVKRAMQQQKAGNRTMRTRRPTVRREARRP
jgi:uncharacterized repeat protein (TIGR04076 family)